MSYTTLIILHNCLGKYYLVDSAYPNTLGYLAPYIGKETRRHIPQFRKYGPPKGVKERFNHRHSSLRMTVERTFGVLKGRWKILADRMPQMRQEQQLEIIVSCCTLHNFIILSNKRISISAREPNLEGPSNVQLYNDSNKIAMDKLRDEIAVMLSSHTV